MITYDKAQQHAIRLLDALGPDVRARLAEDVDSTLRDVFGVAVTYVTTAPSVTAGCDVLGAYHPDPPTITVARSGSAARDKFTLHHEIGHRLVAEDEQLEVELWHLTEAENDYWIELVCDAIAGRLLIPDAVIDEHIPPAGPDASAVFALADATGASLEATAIRAAEKLPGSGYIVVANLDGTVRLAARGHTKYPIRKGTPQDATGPLAIAGDSSSGHHRSSGATLQYATGNRTSPMHADCRRGNGNVVVGVFTTGRPPWGGLSLLPDTGFRGRDVHCEHCGESDISRKPLCRDCGDPPCEHCSKCSCRTAVAEVQCDQCGNLYRSSKVTDGVCVDCDW